MQANYVQRIRLTFSKKGPARYIGHLDLARTFERSLNRVAFPIAYTQGFNRRPRMAFASPLPLGFLSEGELVDLWLEEEVQPSTVCEQIMEKMAPGIVVLQAQEVPLKAPSLQSATRSATYSADMLDPVDIPPLQENIQRVLSAGHLLRHKKGKRKKKKYDLRPLIEELFLDNSDTDQVSIAMKLLLQVGKTGRPDEVLQELELDPLAARIRRKRIFLEC